MNQEGREIECVWMKCQMWPLGQKVRRSGQEWEVTAGEDVALTSIQKLKFCFKVKKKKQQQTNTE